MHDREVTGQHTRHVGIPHRSGVNGHLRAMNLRDVCWAVATDIRSEANDVTFGHALTMDPEQYNAKWVGCRGCTMTDPVHEITPP